MWATAHRTGDTAFTASMQPEALSQSTEGYCLQASDAALTCLASSRWQGLGAMNLHVAGDLHTVRGTRGCTADLGIAECSEAKLAHCLAGNMCVVTRLNTQRVKTRHALCQDPMQNEASAEAEGAA